MYKITCNIAGGLGNQLFQVATVLATAWDQEKEPIFEKKEPTGYIHATRESHWDNIFHNINVVEKLNEKFVIHNELHSQDYKKIPNIQENLILNGYFQTSKYFDKYSSKIVSIFTLEKKDSDIVDMYVNKLRNEYPSKKLVGIHIRRTDYVKLGWDLKLEYFLQAMNFFNKENTVFVCFTDDPKWCKQHIPNIIISDNQKDYIDMFIFSKMDSYIMSNSTFSWWGVYLGNQEKKKKVIAPKPRWIPPIYNIGIYEPNWEII